MRVAWALVLAGALFTSVTPAAPSAQRTAAVAPLPPAAELDLPVLQNISTEPGTVEVNLTAAPGRLVLVPGVESMGLAYNGSSPGPTLEVREGDRVIINFRNELSEPTTVHWHGLHLPVTADGSPFNPVPPGGSYRYEFTVAPGTAGTYWYHPHPHHRTGYQIGLGLYGAVIVRAADDPLAHLPERLIVLSDNRVGSDGVIDLPARGTEAGLRDAEIGREGALILVNGAVQPSLTIRPGEVQRWRVVNASGARVYRLKLTGHRLLHVGSDGGLFEHPEEVDEILLANGERAEVLVRGIGAAGERAVLQALPYDRYAPQWRPADWSTTRDLLTLSYTGSPVATAAIPPRLRAIPVLDTLQASARRTIVMTQGFLNGRAMALDRVDITADLGATEIWEIENLVGMDHPFHLHGFQFQVIDRNGVPERQRQWKDTVNVPKHESARFIVRFDRFAGKWMFHCHILTHEDDGMMGVLEIR